MKTHSLIILLLLSNLVSAQVADNFDDSDLLSGTIWSGQLSSFHTQNKELHSKSTVANSTFFIATPSSASVHSEWRMDIQLLLNTSSLNYVDLVVMSDSSDVTKMRNGYFVRLGGTTDEISLFKTKAGIETRIIDGTDNILNSSNNQWQIILTRTNTGNFKLQRQSLGGGLPIVEGIALDSDIVASSYYGIRIRQSTAAFFGKHFFDNLYAGKIIRDTIAPMCDSVVLAGDKQLQCTFSEICDSLTMADISNYKILQGSINPVSSVVLTGKQVLLNFQNAFVPNTWLDLHIQNIGDKSGNRIISWSKPFYYSKPDTASFRELLITELMPDPDPVVGLLNREYVEIANVSGKFIQLQGCRIHDPSNSRNLPDMVLAPDSIIVLTSVPSLNNSADRVWLTNQKGDIIHTVNYTDAWYLDNTKKNGGWSLEMIDENNICAGAANWRASTDPKGGTPGSVNSVKGVSPPDTKAPLVLSVIPLNDSILHMVFDEEIDSVNSLKTKFLVNGLSTIFKLTGMSGNYYECDWLIDFKPHPDSVYQIIVSGIRDCSGNENRSNPFMVQWPSVSKRNDLIFNEILFNPKTGGYDFIELYNNTGRTFDLSKHFIAVLDETHQYKSIDKLSQLPAFIGPDQYLLISTDTAKVCEQFLCSDEDALKLNFSKMPAMPDDAGNLLLVNLNGKVVDSLVYSEKWHFPLLSDKEGVSLERISFTAPTNNPNSWHSAASIKGFGTPGYLNSQTLAIRPTNQYFSLQNMTVSPDEDGFEDVLILNYNLPKQDFTSSITIYDTEGRLIRQWINNETLGTEGFVAWNGTDYNEQKAAIGIYILNIECTHIDGSRIKEKMSFTVAGKF